MTSCHQKCGGRLQAPHSGRAPVAGSHPRCDGIEVVTGDARAVAAARENRAIEVGGPTKRPAAELDLISRRKMDALEGHARVFVGGITPPVVALVLALSSEGEKELLIVFWLPAGVLSTGLVSSTMATTSGSHQI
jgi:hypothetical protein